MSDSDDEVALSPEAMKALQEFYNTKEAAVVEEDWQLSQFWYTNETAQILANMARSQGTKICCLSAPTVFKELYETRRSEEELKLLEFDRRFGELYGRNFQFYDYKSPDDLPSELKNKFDVVVADPPFLSEECLEKFSRTIRFLTTKSVILCTGNVIRPLVEKLLGLSETSFRPQHARKLGNQFGCFTNFPIKPS